MNKQQLISYGRIFFSLLVFCAIAVQLADSIAQGRSVVNFLSFFTIQSNILAAIILLVVGLGTLAKRKGTPQFAFLRGAATLYMIMTGIIFALLLSGLQHELQTTIPWVNTVLHYAMPIVMLADWLTYPPAAKLRFRQALLWLVYPLGYLIYSLIRGSAVHWYPYPFLNPGTSGWGSVIVTCVIITIGCIGLIWLISLHTGKRKRH